MTHPALPAVTVYDRLRHVAAARPDACALEFQDQSFTYADILEVVERAAALLRSASIGFGDAVVSYATNSPDLLFVYFAAAKLGAVYVPVNPNMSAAEVGYIYGHSDAKLLLHASLAAGVAERLVPTQCRQLLSNVTATTVPEEANLPPCGAVSRKTDFLICYTSGSTGAPKAVVLDHGSQVDVCASLSEFWGLTESDVTLVALPLGYLFGLTTASAAGLLSGGSVVLLPKYRPSDVLEAMIARHATIFHGVPTMFTMMLEYVEQNRASFDLSAVRQLICAGAPLPEEIAQRFARTFGKPLRNYYAATECSPVIGHPDAHSRALPPGSIGCLAPGAEVRIVSAEGHDCPVGVEGEFYVRGAATMNRYLKNPELTATALSGGWFRTGDLGQVDAAGYYFITGRIKDTIFRGGANIAPAEVEAVLSTHPDVANVAVVGAPDKIYGEVPVAYIVPRGDSRPGEQALISHAQASLADFKIPRHYVLVGGLPLGKTGKIDKSALKAAWALPDHGACSFSSNVEDRQK